jgi:hypothetical protein
MPLAQWKSERTPIARPAAPADAGAADALLDSACAPYAGPIDRSRLPRPPVPRDARRFVVETGGVLAGLATFGATGGVLDWAVSEGPAAGEIAAALLAAGETWVVEQGGNEILLYVPRDAAPSPALLMELGYRPVPPPHTVMQAVHFPNLLSALAGERSEILGSLSPVSVALHLEPGLYPPLDEPDLLIRVGGAGTTVTAETADADVSVTTTATRFSEFLFGARSTADFLADEVRMEPAGRTAAAVAVLEALAFGRPWYVPLGERR